MVLCQKRVNVAFSVPVINYWDRVKKGREVIELYLKVTGKYFEQY